MIMCNVKEVIHGDKPTDIITQLCSSPQSSAEWFSTEVLKL